MCIPGEIMRIVEDVANKFISLNPFVKRFNKQLYIRPVIYLFHFNNI